MSNFKSMFPNVNSLTIEQTLRKHNGDVTNTINEILEISAFIKAAKLNNASTSNLLSINQKNNLYDKKNFSQNNNQLK